jgi:transcription elongation factor GreA
MHKQAERSGAQIGLGSTVTLAVLDREGEDVKFTVVERGEADPRRGWISREAPMARAVVGKRVGDEVAVPTPRAERHYQIVAAT